MTTQERSCADFDWMEGETLIHPDTGDPINLFRCSKQEVINGYDTYVIPKDAKVYHGSVKLADELVEFPVGREYYYRGDEALDPGILSLVASGDEGIEELVADLNGVYITPSWYSDPRIASLYTRGCSGPSCVFVYKLKRDIRLFRLDSHRNVYKLMSGPQGSTIRPTLEIIMGVTLSDYDESKERFITMDKFNVPRYGMRRNSDRDYDMEFARWFCRNMSSEWDGYGADAIDSTVEEGQSTFSYTYDIKVPREEKFHPEIILCDPFAVLVRSYETYDWQALDIEEMPLAVQDLMSQMYLYKTINTAFHSGNLLQHSVWTLLWAESLMEELRSSRARRIEISDELERLAAFTAFIHDVGKMKPLTLDESGFPEVVITRTEPQNFIYYEVKEHPLYGAHFVLQDNGPTMYDERDLTKEIQQMQLSVVAKSMEVEYTTNDMYIVATALFMHRELGMMLLRPLNERTLLAASPEFKARVNEYILKVYTTLETIGGPKELRRDALLVTCIVSGADISATQPFPNPRAGDNATSENFPYISNLSKNYSGTSINTSPLELLIVFIMGVKESDLNI